MAKNSTVIDIDAQLTPVSDEPVHTRPVRLFGAEWTLVCDVNSFEMAYVSTGDAQAIVDFLINSVIEEERGMFARTFAAQPSMSPERLGEILRSLVEVMAERPTTPRSVSGSQAAARTVVRNSKAGTAARRAARSTS